MRGFGELEAEIMERMWVLGRPATVRDVYDDLRASRDSAYTTVMTVTGILHRKGWLRRERHGRAWRYEPTLTREEYVARSMRVALDDAHDREAVFTHFIQQVSPEESRALRAVLTRLVEEEDR